MPYNSKNIVFMPKTKFSLFRMDFRRDGKSILATGGLSKARIEHSILDMKHPSDGKSISIILKTSAGDIRRIDARPSDAIALAVRTGAPIFVSRHVLAATGAEAP